MRIAVFGAGAWGTALAVAFSGNHSVVLWGRDEKLIEVLRQRRENPRYLPGVPLPTTLAVTSRLDQAAQEADLHVVVTPLSGLRDCLHSLRTLAPRTPMVWASKGLEAESGRLPHELVIDAFDHLDDCGMLTGPSFAAEVGAGLPTAITLASRDLAFAQHWGAILHQTRLRIYANDDLVGAEIGAAIKNVMAIAAGVSDGLGFGLNARAALITRGLAETARLAGALGGKADTLMGLAGMGDLILTCTGDLSRNRRVGLLLAEGKRLTDILRDLGHVAEGVPTTHAALALANRVGVEMPICEAVGSLLKPNPADPREAVERLLAREPRQE